MNTCPPNFILLLVLVIGGIGCDRAQQCHNALEQLPSNQSTPVANDQDSRSVEIDIEALLQPKLKLARRQTSGHITQHLESVGQFFDQAYENTPEFVDFAMSLGSKSKMAWDLLPFTSNTSHQRYLAENFEAIVFSDDDLKKLIDFHCTQYSREITDIENQVLIALCSDVDLTSLNLPPAQIESMLSMSAIEAILQSSSNATENEIYANVSVMTASLLVERVAAKIATRLATSGGILATGAATSEVSFGTSLAIAITVDWLVSSAWDWYSQPKAKLCKEIRHRLGRTKFLLIAQSQHDARYVDGELYQHFEHYTSERFEAFENALKIQLSHLVEQR